MTFCCIYDTYSSGPPNVSQIASFDSQESVTEHTLNPQTIINFSFDIILPKTWKFHVCFSWDERERILRYQFTHEKRQYDIFMT